jgi:signal transduction histidine kinase
VVTIHRNEADMADDILLRDGWLAEDHLHPASREVASGDLGPDTAKVVDPDAAGPETVSPETELAAAGDECVRIRHVLAPATPPAALEDAATDRLRSLIGHELRTPLTSVKGFARLLARRDVPQEEVRHFGELIADAVDRFDRVVDQLTAYTLLGSGRVEATLEAVEVEELVQRTVARWRTTELDPVVDAGGAGIVPLDRAVVALALDELLDNAARFAGPHPAVVVSAHRVDGDLLLSVADDGPGMSPAVVAACFEEFTQGDSPLTRNVGGLGLGLAIVRTVARLHGGAVICDSGPGHGTTVTLALPSL